MATRYEEGLGAAWDPIRRYWATPSAENREALRRAVLTPEGTRWQYTHRAANPETVAPESYTLDQALMERPGNTEVQLDLFLDYASNLNLYLKFQAYFREFKPPLLAIWGEERSVFHTGRGRGVPPRQSQCHGEVVGYRAFCVGDARGRDCRGHA
jgi:hypothetical protein